jgi:alpha-beta hydrolase superfamily lysophospholipase
LGFSTYCPLYPAHGIEDMVEAKKAMAQISAELFVKFALDLIQEKRKQNKKVFIFGQSLGAILTTYLAGQQVADAAAVTVGPLGLPKFLLWIAKFGVRFGMDLSTMKPPLESGWPYEFLNAQSVSTIFELIALARANLECYFFRNRNWFLD